MLHINPIVIPLLDSTPDDWARSLPSTGNSHWVHAHGVGMMAYRTRSAAGDRTWTLSLYARGTSRKACATNWAQQTLFLPRTHLGSVGANIAPILHDIAAWKQGLDLEPVQRIARTLASWMVLHGCSTDVLCCMRTQENTRLTLQPGNPLIRTEAVPVPPEMQLLLHSDMTAAWALMPLHLDQAYAHATRSQTSARTFIVRLPSSHHARMDLLANADLRLKNIPLPVSMPFA